MNITGLSSTGLSSTGLSSNGVKKQWDHNWIPYTEDSFWTFLSIEKELEKNGCKIVYSLPKGNTVIPYEVEDVN
jgi:hypothetical protein